MTTPLQFLAGAKALLGEGASLPVQQAALKLGEATIYEHANVTLAGFATNNVVNLQVPVQIDILIWSGNHPTKAQLRLQPYKSGSASPIAEPKSDGSGVHGWSPAEINQYGSAYWETLVYDTGNNYYQFALRRPLFFPEGVIVQLRNTAAEEGNVNIAASVLGRRFG